MSQDTITTPVGYDKTYQMTVDQAQLAMTEARKIESLWGIEPSMFHIVADDGVARITTISEDSSNRLLTVMALLGIPFLPVANPIFYRTFRVNSITDARRAIDAVRRVEDDSMSLNPGVHCPFYITLRRDGRVEISTIHNGSGFRLHVAMSRLGIASELIDNPPRPATI
jgi:hypothetical protein